MPAAPPSTALALSSFSDTTPVVIDADSGPLSLCVDDVLKYIAPGAPRHEALLFLMTCKAMRINPLVREAFLIPSKEKWSTVVAKSGYTKAAQRHDAYNGHDAGIVGQPYDPSKIRPNTPPPFTGPPVDFEGTLLPAGYLLVGGWGKAWRKGVDRPITSRVSMTEYAKSSRSGMGTWDTMPCTMIRKVALVAALREAFSLSGFDEAEMHSAVVQAMDNEPTSSPVATATTPLPDGWVRSEAWVIDPSLPKPPAPKAEKSAPTPRLPAEMAERLQELMTRAGMSEFQVNTALVKRGVDRIVDLDLPSATQMINKLEATLSAAEWDPLNDKGKEAPTEVETPTVTEAFEAAAAIEAETPITVGDTAPRVREPGDDDEPFDDATGKVVDADFEKVAGDARTSAQIAEEFDRPLDEATAKELKAAARKSKAALAGK